MRLFIALPLPEEVRAAALGGIAALRRQGTHAQDAENIPEYPCRYR